MVFRDPERMAGLHPVERECARRDRGAPERVPGAGRVIVADAGVERDSRSDGDLVPEHECRQKLPTVPAPERVRGGENGGQQSDPRVSFGELVAVMSVEGIDGRGARVSGTGRARPASVEDQAGAVRTGSHLRDREGVDDARQIGGTAACRDAD
jgi:hypothetical protein